MKVGSETTFQEKAGQSRTSRAKTSLTLLSPCLVPADGGQRRSGAQLPDDDHGGDQFGQPLGRRECRVFTGTITGSSITPTGTVDYFDGPVTLCAASGLSGTPPFVAARTVAANALTIGTHGVTAVYTGDADDGASTSSVLLQTVN